MRRRRRRPSRVSKVGTLDITNNRKQSVTEDFLYSWTYLGCAVEDFLLLFKGLLTILHAVHQVIEQLADLREILGGHGVGHCDDMVEFRWAEKRWVSDEMLLKLATS